MVSWLFKQRFSVLDMFCFGLFVFLACIGWWWQAAIVLWGGSIALNLIEKFWQRRKETP